MPSGARATVSYADILERRDKMRVPSKDRHFGQLFAKALPRLVLTFFLLLFSFPALVHASGVKLTILHLNDTHGHIVPYIDKRIDDATPVSGAAYLSKMIQDLRAANPDGTILLSAGDMFQGTPISNLFRGRPVIEILNYLKYDAMALGNHEFDWGQDVLRQIVSSAHFPVLSANITKGRDQYFDGVKPSILITRKKIPIGIIGFTTTEAEYTSKPGNLAGLSIAPPEEVAPRLIKDLRSKGAALIIVLSHLGLDADRQLARQVPGIDIIVGGHSHTAITQPVNESGTIIVQAGCYGVYLGALDIIFDPAKRMIVSHTEKDVLKLVSAGPRAPSDPRAAEIVESYEKQVKSEFSKVIGTASVDLTRQFHRESSLGDLITDALREASGAQISFYNGGGIRADVPMGPITLESVFTVLPFDNMLMTVQLTGEQIRQLLEQSIISDKDLQVSGLKVEYDLSMPSGSKVLSVKVGEDSLDPVASYRVATNDFLGAGGDRYAIFAQGRDPVFGAEVRDVVIDYIRSHSPIDTGVRDRIIFRK